MLSVYVRSILICNVLHSSFLLNGSDGSLSHSKCCLWQTWLDSIDS